MKKLTKCVHMFDAPLVATACRPLVVYTSELKYGLTSLRVNLYDSVVFSLPVRLLFAFMIRYERLRYNIYWYVMIRLDCSRHNLR